MVQPEMKFNRKKRHITFKANIPNKEDPLRARSSEGWESTGTLLINNPYKPIPKINITVPARYTSALRWEFNINISIKNWKLSMEEKSWMDLLTLFIRLKWLTKENTRLREREKLLFTINLFTSFCFENYFRVWITKNICLMNSWAPLIKKMEG